MRIQVSTVTLAVLAAGLFFCPETPAAPAGPLREARAVLRLPPAQARRGLPVVLRGVVTYIKPEGIPDLVLQDETGGVFVHNSPRPPPSDFRPGAFVELRGRTTHVEFSPSVSYEAAEVLGSQPLPVPSRVTLDELQSARFHCQYVEVGGVVRSVQQDLQLTPPRLLLKLATPSGLLDVWVLRFDGAERLQLVDARVRVRGVCLHWINTRRQPISLRLLVNDLEAITIERTGPPDIFAAPFVPLEGMLQYRPDGVDQHRVRIRGVVTLHHPGENLVLQDGTLAVRVRPAVAGEAAVGDEVEATGFVGRGTYSAELQEAVFRVVARPGPPAPLEIGEDGLPEALSTGELDQRLVQWKARVTGVRLEEGLLTLQVEAGKHQHAALLKNPPLPLPRGLRAGSQVELAGIAGMEVSERSFVRGDTPKLAGLMLRDARDLRVVKAGPWVTVKNLLLLAGAGCGALVLTLLWVFTLRRRVERRTAQLAREIRARHDAEVEFKASLAERTRLGAELHDTLEQSLTGLSLQLQAAELAIEARPVQSRDYIRSARDLLDQSRNDLRTSLSRLRASRKPRRDLVADLREMAEPMALGTNRTIVVEGSCPPRDVPELVAHQALRVAQESLTNAVKHSLAGNIRIVVGLSKECLTLQVTDNGIGFRPDEAADPDAGHYGILGMRERVQRLGGRLDLHSAPGAGTTVIAKLPLANPRDYRAEPREAQ